MIEEVLDRIVSSSLLRLVLAGIMVILPVGITTSWLGAAYQQALGGTDIVRLMLRYMSFGSLATFVSGLLVVYPLERWVIDRRAVNSWSWAVARILLYMVAGFPIGLATLIVVERGVRESPTAVRSFYFVQAVTIGSVVAIIYTFIERLLEGMRRREERLRSMIKDLEIEINEMQRAHQVAEITETEYFQNLRVKARELRDRNG